ncbi:MAG: SWIM zinc finger family protein [Myxococcota bacterium]
MGYWGHFGPYVSVGERRAKALREIAKRAKKGQVLAPIQPDGRALATTFWGKAWCDHVEHHCDEANRLPRGRSYFRNGAVIDLKILEGKVTALVQGSDLYEVEVTVKPLETAAWSAVARDCAGQIDSLVELLQGRLDKGVLQRLCDPREGMFPRARQMTFECSCPDGAHLCKHVAAALYGVGNRLDAAPELLFRLRQVDQHELLRQAAVAPVATGAPKARVLDDASLGDVFGLEFDAADVAPVRSVVREPARVSSGSSRRVAKKAEISDSPEEFVLRVLREFSDRELRLADLASEAGGRHTKEALRQAATRLHRQGLVERTSEGGAVWWAVVHGPGDGQA